MNQNLNGTIVVFDDDPNIVISLHRQLKQEFPHAQVLWSLTPDRKPRTDVPKRGTAINNPTWTHPLTPSDLIECDAIVLDLQMKLAGSNNPDSSKAVEDYGSFNGFFVLDLAEKHNCLSKIFVSSAVMDVMRVKKLALAQRLETLVANEEIGVYRKDRSGPEDLLVRIYSILDLKRRGYICSTKTRNKLFLIGSSEGLSMEPVLIVGKTGTGKESAAWHIHEMGQRMRAGDHRDLPLMVVHCGGLTPELARDELFGHTKGAFTGANGFKVGSVLKSLALRGGEARSTSLRAWLLNGNPDYLEAAGRGGINLRVTSRAPFGTIFLDEFGELDPSVQALLLRFLDNGEIQPLGYEGTISLKDERDQLHVRLIGATNRSIGHELLNTTIGPEPQAGVGLALGKTEVRTIQQSGVREDLIFRIARWVVELPDMTASEVEDLIELEQSRRTDLRDVIWEPTALTRLREVVRAGGFPGQRRELRTVAMRAMAFAKGVAALGMNLYNEPPTVDLRILEEATRPVRIERGGGGNTDSLHAAVCDLLRNSDVWPACQEGFHWEDLRDFDRVEVCRLFLRSLRFVGDRPYLLEDVELAWGLGVEREGTIRASLRRYVHEALKKELGSAYSDAEFPSKIKYKELRTKLRRLQGDLSI